MSVSEAKELLERTRQQIEKILKPSYSNRQVRLVLLAIDDVVVKLDYIEQANIVPKRPREKKEKEVKKRKEAPLAKKRKEKEEAPLVKKRKEAPKRKEKEDSVSAEEPPPITVGGQDIPLDTFIEQLKENVNETKILVESYRGKSVQIQCKTPDVSIGDNILSDAIRMQRYLSDVGGDQTPIEELGSLMRWWRIVERAFAISGIFKELKQRKSRKTLQDAYNAEIEKLAPVRLYKYRHARTYATMGAFLEKHPMLVNQTLVITLTEWQPLIDHVDAALSAEKPSLHYLKKYQK